MRKTLIIGLLMFCHSVFGQIPGKKFDGELVIFDTLTIKKGDVIFLGKGSDPNSGNFTYITTPKKYMTDISGNKSHAEFKNTPQGISNNYNGRSFPIKDFSKVSSKKKGDMILGVIDIGPSFDGKLDMGIYKQAVIFESAILAGEIIKINDIDFTNSSKRVTREIPYFVIGKDGIQPVLVDFEGLSKDELYRRTLNWYANYYSNKGESFITTFENELVEITARKKMLISKISGIDLFADLEYRFQIEFMENKIRMDFISVSEDAQSTDIGSQQELDSLDKNESLKKMSENLKQQTEQMMNEIPSSLVDFLMK
jgi:hypothetical protein